MKPITEIKDYQDENGNKIIGAAYRAENCKVFFSGKNNTFLIAPGLTLFPNTIIRFDSDNGLLKFEKSCVFGGIIRVGLECKIEIGENLRVTEKAYFSTAEKTNITIGKNCMFAQQNHIKTDDSHPIFSIDDDSRTNFSQSINIGEHVWLAAEVAILGGSEIGAGSVIGMRSVVTGKKIPTNCIAAGIPAKVIKENIYWENTHLNNHSPHFFPNPTKPKSIYK